MSRPKSEVKKNGFSGTAPLRNIAHMESLIGKIMNRPAHLPGIGCFSGPSGFGKSTAGAWIAAKYNCVYVEVRSTWTRKAFLEAILKQLGIRPEKTVYQMMDQVAEELALSHRVLMLDEFDHAVDRNLVELVRDIYEQSKTPTLLIGEERLPQKLQKWERFHGRIMDFIQAQPADINDARALNSHYVPEVTVADDLLQVLVTEARGSIRRIVTNIERISQFAKGEGLETVGVKEWGKRELHTANTPAVRRF